MSLFPCRACPAKDAEIARLDALTKELLGLVRDATGLTPREPVAEGMQSALAPLEPEVEVFLDAKFVRGTPMWRQQRREAEKLASEGIESERIMETLAKGQRVEF